MPGGFVFFERGVGEFGGLGEGIDDLGLGIFDY
jgi:hypothetical protein